MFQQKRLRVLLSGLLFAGPALWAQNNGNAPPAAPANPAKVEAPTTEKLDPNGVAQPIDPRSYEIGAEDVLRIVVWQSQEFSTIQAVRPDGKISMPLIGDVQAEGLTPNRLKTTLTEALKDYLESPDVTIYIQQVNSKSYRVNGFVNRPGRYPLVTPIRVYQAIADAGGFREYAKTKEVVIVRGPTMRIKFNAEDYRKGKNPEQNIFLENGDIVEIYD